MSKFKVGDRVAAYFWDGRNTGELEKLNGNGSFEFKADRYSARVAVSPKQCRKLVKKPRRELWVTMKDGQAFGLYYGPMKPADGFELVHFREVVKK